ncbi:opioid growth factor receptor-like protein 1 isoform X1 [Pelobates fuscus]|uniref:opioid growth factor receptor-like protein 1 isoform X1 n=1 Tax=Pelobates fuscus TaxID=191477 RepID=UPI002FE436F2
MGNLLNGVSFKEPTTVEDCDSTWETDSGGEEEEEAEHGERADGKQEEKAESGGADSAAEEGTGELSGGADGKAGQTREGTASPLAEQNDSNTAEPNIKPKRSFYAARDLYKYRHQYPQNFKDLRSQNDLCNLRFYMNKIPFKPDGVYVEDILNKWKTDYERLEHNHTYIQWLFPLREQGLNFYAKELTSYEIEEFKKTKEAVKRFILAYKIMLDFFGLKLMDKNGNVSRAANWQERFQHLNESQHNYLRITRILKSLGELGYENFKFPLVKLFLHESIVENTIPNMKQSALEYFVHTIKERRQRRRLLRFAYRHYKPPEHFIWGPPRRQKFNEYKVIKKSTPPTRSQKKPLQKSKDTESLCEPEISVLTDSKTEVLAKQSTENNFVEEAVKISEEATESENGSKEHYDNEETTVTSHENELERQDAVTNNTMTCDIHDVVIVDSTDVESKDCLCSLSPANPNTVELTVPAGENLEPTLERKDEAK